MIRFIFFTSLATNVVLAAVIVLRSPISPTPVKCEHVVPITASPAPETVTAKEPVATSRPTFGSQKELIDYLRSAGVSPYVIYSVAGSMLAEKYGQKRLEVQNRNKRYQWETISAKPPGREQLAELAKIRVEEETEMRLLMGDEAYYAMKGATMARNPYLAKLSSEKLAAIVDAKHAYAEIQFAARADGVLLDRAATAALDAELESEISEALSPEELASYKFATSDTARLLSSALQGRDISEDKFRSITLAVEGAKSPYEKAQAARAAGGDQVAVDFIKQYDGPFGSAVSGLRANGANDTVILAVFDACRKDGNSAAEAREVYAEVSSMLTPEQKKAFDASKEGKHFRLKIDALNQMDANRTKRP